MMKIFDIKTKNTKDKKERFQRPEFQKKLQKARSYVRKPQKKYSNGNKKQKNLSGVKRTVLKYTAITIAVAAVYFLFIGNTFVISDVRESAGLSGEQVRDVLKSLSEQRKYLIKKNHFILLNKQAFERAIKNNYPRVRAVESYSRILPGSLKAVFEMRQPKYIWRSGNDFYIVDQDGVVFQQVTNYNPAVYEQTLITDTTAAPTAVGQDLKIKRALDFYKNLLDVWQENIAVTSPKAIDLPGNKSVDMFVETELGFEVMFDLRRPPQTQVKNLQLLLNREIDSSTYAGLAYIDLRLPQVAYYCYKDAPCASDEPTEEESQNQELE